MMTPVDPLRGLRRDDDGQLLLLVLCYTVIAALLITVIVNVSKVYLYRRALVAAADGAALAAANAPDLEQIYRGAPGNDAPILPLSQPGTRRAVDTYVTAAQLAHRFADFDVAAVTTDGRQVTVTLTATARMPFLNLLSSEFTRGYVVQASSTARTPL